MLCYDVFDNRPEIPATGLTGIELLKATMRNLFMYDLSMLHTIYENSPVGFLLAEVLYEGDIPADFAIRYINSSAATMLGLPAELVREKRYDAIQCKKYAGWIHCLHTCIKNDCRKEIYEFAGALNHSLKMECFPCEENICGCFVDAIPKNSTERIAALRQFDTITLTADDAELLEAAKRYLTHSVQFAGLTAEKPTARLSWFKKSKIRKTMETAEAMNMLQSCIDLLSEDMPPEYTLRCILERACKFFRASSGCVSLHMDKDTKTAWARDKSVQAEPFPGIQSEMCFKELTAMLREQAYIFIPDIGAADISERYKEEWSEKNIKSLCFLPVFLEENLIGFVSLTDISANESQMHIIPVLLKMMGNIARRTKLREENVQLQYIDTLTGYLNLESFKKVAAKILHDNPHKHYALCACDIKRFKYVNDMFGYNVGDALLKYWADTVNGMLHEQETFCRVSADNFIILKCYEDAAETEHCFRSITAKLNEFSEFGGQSFRIDCVAGICLLNESDIANPDINKLMDKAGTARSSIKGTGHRIAFYDHTMRERQLREVQVCQMIHDGLKEQQFHVCFQPQYDYTLNDIIGAEALVRWKHPSLGWISPKDFVPVLEKNDLIGQLDLFVWEEACKFLHQLTEHNCAGAPLRSVSVNVSRLDIYMKELKDILLALVERYELHPSRLHLEITEGAYIEDSNYLIATIENLRNCGFNVHMDDFGSGYSSLNILKDVPVNVLKLDMKFLSAENTERGANILSSIMGMAQHIGLPVIAEGVETKVQADYLHSLGCRYMQGYYFARPMTAEHFTQFLEERKKNA